MHHEPSDLDVHCPDCAESFVVSIDIIESSQHMLDELGYCAGPASFECPAPYFASLATPETIAHLRVTEPPSPRPPSASPHDLARWEDDGGACATLRYR
jgi:hypothetical protein